MRWLAVFGGLVLVAALAWWANASPEPAPPLPVVRETAPVAAVEAPAGVDGGVAAREDEPPVAAADAGPANLEVVVEVFGSEGHAAGASVSFHAEPAGGVLEYYEMRRPDAAVGETVGSGRTNVMGFMTVSLPPGRWLVNPPAEPQYVVIRPETREIAVHLRSPHIVRGLVVDWKGAPAPLAEVRVLRDGAGYKRDWSMGRPLQVGADGRFTYSTFDSSLTLFAGHRGADRDHVFRKRINVPCPEVRLYMGAPAKVELTLTGMPDARMTPITIEAEAVGVTIDATTLYGPTHLATLIPGHVEIRARAVVREHRYLGRAEVDAKVSETVRAKLEMVPAPAQRVHLVDSDLTPVPQAQVILNSPGYAAAATTDASGDARFEPGVATGLGVITVTDRCLAPMPALTVFEDEVTVTVVPCAVPDSGFASDGGYAPAP